MPVKSTSTRQYVIDFPRLEFSETLPGEEPDYQCVIVDEDEVVPGWRTALRKMNEANVWELVVPAPLAYGSNGTTSDNEEAQVEPGEALRFLIRLRNRT